MSDVEEGAEGDGQKKKGKEKKKKEDDKPAKEKEEKKKKEEKKAEEESEDSFSRYDPDINILLSHLTRAEDVSLDFRMDEKSKFQLRNSLTCHMSS